MNLARWSALLLTIAMLFAQSSPAFADEADEGTEAADTALATEAAEATGRTAGTTTAGATEKNPNKAQEAHRSRKKKKRKSPGTGAVLTGEQFQQNVAKHVERLRTQLDTRIKKIKKTKTSARKAEQLTSRFNAKVAQVTANALRIGAKGTVTAEEVSSFRRLSRGLNISAHTSRHHHVKRRAVRHHKAKKAAKLGKKKAKTGAVAKRARAQKHKR